MAIEWGQLGIRVNAVAPGLIDAGMSEPIYADPTTRRARESKVPLGRLGTSDDIASAVLFLASEQASYIHGQNLVVDGGVTGSVIAHLPRPASVDSVGHTPTPQACRDSKPEATEYNASVLRFDASGDTSAPCPGREDSRACGPGKRP